VISRLTRAAALPALVLLLYAFLFPWVPALRSPNELSRLYQARAIVEDHSLAVNAQLARHGPVGDLSVKDGRYYPNKAPGVSFAGAAAYAVARAAHGGRPIGEAEAIFWLRLLVCMVPGAMAAELLRQILARRFEPALATSGALVFALGTIMWPYSTLFMSHGPTAAAVVACWWAIERAVRSPFDFGPLRGPTLRANGRGAPGQRDPESARSTSGMEPGTRDPRSVRPEPFDSALARYPQGRRSRRANGIWLLAGLMGGCAVLLEYTSALALLPLAFHAWRSPPPAERAEGQGEGHRRRWHALVGAVPPILALALYHHAAFGNALHTGYRHLVNPTFAEWHGRGFMGVGAPSLAALAGSFLDPARGLFVWCPFLALGVPGLVLLSRRDRALTLLCASELALYALFSASFTYEAWGWVVGPRHITTVCAFLIPPALAAAEWLRDRGLGFVAAGLALAGMALVAVTTAVCPYLPEELTNPFWQLVVPLARMGLRSTDVLGVALHARSWWTLVPWAVVLAACALSVAISLSSRGKEKAGGWMFALVVAAALLTAQSRLGGPDHFAPTRAFMAAALEPRDAVPGASR